MTSIQYGASLAKGVFPIAGAAGTTALRVGLAALILAVTTRLWRFRLNSRQLQAVSIYGASLGGMNLLFYFSLEKIPLGIAVAVEFTGPLAVALISTRKPVDLLWAFLAAIGIYLILPLDDTAMVSLSGILLALGAGMFWALYIVFGKRSSGLIPSHFATAYGMIFAAVVTLPFGIYFHTDQAFDSSFMVKALLIALLSSTIPYSLEMRALQALPAKTFGILMSLEPAVAALIGAMFLKEQLTPPQWIALLSIMAASAGATWTAKPAPVKELDKNS